MLGQRYYIGSKSTSIQVVWWTKTVVDILIISANTKQIQNPKTEQNNNNKERKQQQKSLKNKSKQKTIQTTAIKQLLNF